MESKVLQTLNIDKDFKNLIRPLQKKEYLQLEANLLTDGCRDPIITWNGFIIDGHSIAIKVISSLLLRTRLSLSASRVVYCSNAVL